MLNFITPAAAENRQSNKLDQTKQKLSNPWLLSRSENAARRELWQPTTEGIIQLSSSSSALIRNNSAHVICTELSHIVLDLCQIHRYAASSSSPRRVSTQKQ
jgi:hypothetical protein